MVSEAICCDYNVQSSNHIDRMKNRRNTICTLATAVCLEGLQEGYPTPTHPLASSAHAFGAVFFVLSRSKCVIENPPHSHTSLYPRQNLLTYVELSHHLSLSLDPPSPIPRQQCYEYKKKYHSLLFELYIYLMMFVAFYSFPFSMVVCMYYLCMYFYYKNTDISDFCLDVFPFSVPFYSCALWSFFTHSFTIRTIQFHSPIFSLSDRICFKPNT